MALPPSELIEAEEGVQFECAEDQWWARSALFASPYPLIGMGQQPFFRAPSPGPAFLPLMVTPPLSSQGSDESPDFPLVGPGPPIATSNIERGPVNSNLFVFHLPSEMTNWDLYLLFRRFGTLLSVHIMVCRQTGLSRGYGFISYASPADAATAIAQMDGFRLGMKRLKVELKRENGDSLGGDSYASSPLEEESKGQDCPSSL